MTYRSIKIFSAGLILVAFLKAQGNSNSQDQSPSSVKDIFEAGRHALVAGRYADASRDFERLLSMGQRSAPVLTNLGVAYLHTGRIDEAIRILNEAKRLAPRMPGIDLNLGLAYYRLREFKQAIPFFSTVLAAEDSNVQARYLNGVCHFMVDDFDGAAKELEVLKDQDRGDLEYLFMLGISYGKLKRDTDAQQVFTQLVTNGGDTPHLHQLLGKAYLALGDYQNARAELEKSVAGDPHLPYSHYYLGVLYDKLGQSNAAVIEFEKETKISPTDPWAYENVARIKLDEGDTKYVIAFLQRAVGSIPESASLYAALGKAYSRKSEYAQAIPQLQHAIALEPENGNYHYQLGRVYLETGRKKEGDAEIAKARTLQTNVLEGQMEALSKGH